MKLWKLTIPALLLGLSATPAFAEILQIDSDFDGKPDQWHHRSEDGKLIKIDYDTNADGKLENVLVSSPGSEALNPAFDVTPARLVTAIITEKGIFNPEDLATLNI